MMRQIGGQISSWFQGHPPALYAGILLLFIACFLLIALLYWFFWPDEATNPKD